MGLRFPQTRFSNRKSFLNNSHHSWALSRSVRGDPVLTQRGCLLSPPVPFPFSPSSWVSLGSEPLTRGLSFHFLLPPCPSSYPVGLVSLSHYPASPPWRRSQEPTKEAPTLPFPSGSPALPLPYPQGSSAPNWSSSAQVKSEQELGEVQHVADHAQRTFLVQSVGQSEVSACW